jgi:hypothetical protein
MSARSSVPRRRRAAARTVVLGPSRRAECFSGAPAKLSSELGQTPYASMSGTPPSSVRRAMGSAHSGRYSEDAVEAQSFPDVRLSRQGGTGTLPFDQLRAGSYVGHGPVRPAVREMQWSGSGGSEGQACSAERYGASVSQMNVVGIALAANACPGRWRRSNRVRAVRPLTTDSRPAARSTTRWMSLPRVWSPLRSDTGSLVAASDHAVLRDGARRPAGLRLAHRPMRSGGEQGPQPVPVPALHSH